MKHLLLTLLALALSCSAFADSILIEGFEYANHDFQIPIGWSCDDQSWLCGYQDKDHNRTPHSGNWYAFTNAEESWMFMPLYFSSTVKYRFSCWAVSDGDYDLEFWIGNAAQPDQMVQCVGSFPIGGGEYESVSNYVESITGNYPYFAVRAVAHEGAYHLTIDDLYVDMVPKYEIMATPTNADTVLYPGTQATYHFSVHNLGYEPITVIISPSHEYFNNFHFYLEGNACTSFPMEPDEVKHITAEATLLPSITPGTTCWLDIILALDCDCATAMTTLWVTVLDPTLTEEAKEDAMIFPIPADDHVSIREKGLRQVEICDLYGRKVLSTVADHDDLWLDVSHFSPGIYLITTRSERGSSTRKMTKR